MQKAEELFLPAENKRNKRESSPPLLLTNTFIMSHSANAEALMR